MPLRSQQFPLISKVNDLSLPARNQRKPFRGQVHTTRALHTLALNPRQAYFIIVRHPTLLQMLFNTSARLRLGLYVCCVAFFFYFCWHRNWKWINCVSKVKVVGHFSGWAIISNCWYILETEGFIWHLLLKIVVVWSSDHWSFSPLGCGGRRIGGLPGMKREL